MLYNYKSFLWQKKDESFYRDLHLNPKLQIGPRCVANTLATITNKSVADFEEKINTQDPASWSIALEKYGMKLAYCPTDVRKMKYYISELLLLDDLFTISYYSPRNPEMIFKDPSENGWICGSHIVVLHRNKIYDSATGLICLAENHDSMNSYIKRIFRVIPLSHSRGL